MHRKKHRCKKRITTAVLPYITTLFFSLGAKWGGCLNSRLYRFIPGKTRYPLYRKLSGPYGRSGRVRKISALPGFDPRTVQPVASIYACYAFPTYTV